MGRDTFVHSPPFVPFVVCRLRYFDEHVAETIRTDSTRSFSCPDDAVAVPLEDLAVALAPPDVLDSGMPVISTCWFTCDARSVSCPSSSYDFAIELDEVDPVALVPVVPVAPAPEFSFRMYCADAVPVVPVVPVADDPVALLADWVLRSRHPVTVIARPCELLDDDGCAEDDGLCAITPATARDETTATAPVHVFQCMY